MRIAVVAHDYHKENLRLQPWRYVHEMVKGFETPNNEVFIITNGHQFQRDTLSGNVPVIHLNHVRHFPPIASGEITRTIETVNPDVVLWLTGLTCFFQRRLYRRLGYSMVSLVGSPVYSAQELLRNLSPADILKNHEQLTTTVAETLAPRTLIKDTFNLDCIKAVVTMSRKNRERLESLGVRPDKLATVPAGVDPDFLQLPPANHIKDARDRACADNHDCFLITYLGPPLTIRGVDTLLFAVRMAAKSPSQLRILFLSREQGNQHRTARQSAEKLAAKLGLGKTAIFENRHLDRENVKAYLAASDLIALPFKHTVSDVPVSILEGMCLGKPVLSTNVDGIPELLENGRGLITQPGEVRSLAAHIAYYSENRDELKIYGRKARDYMLSYPTWRDSASEMLRLLERCA